MSKFISLAVVLALFVTLAISCADTKDGGGAETTDTSAAAAQTEAVTDARSTVDVKDYNGYTFKIASTNQNDRQTDFMAQEENGATLNDLVFRRNMQVEETYNIKIEASAMDFGAINTLIQKNVSAGDNTYDLHMSNATAYTLASGGYLLALNNMPGLDITKPWWDQDAISGMSIGGNIYMITGDITPNGMLSSECVLFNKNLFTDRGIAYPYDSAFAGTWTLDEMYAICGNLSEDINGDGKYNSKDDLFSITCWFDAAHGFFYGAGGQMIKKDSEDIPSLSWDIEKNTAIYMKIYDLIITSNGFYSTTDHEYSFKVFEEGRAYFCELSFQKVGTFLRNMNDDYGVLPLPKYDELQSRYVSDMTGACSMVVVPITTQDPERTGNIIDALGAAAYDMISPSLYDVIASVKNVRDEESAQMVQLIIRNRVFDMSHMYYIAGDDFVYDLLKAKSTDVASYFAKREATAKDTVTKLIDDFLANNKPA